VPSNLVLVRVGARPWLARIMINMFGVFWAHAGDLLGDAAAAGGFALINSSSALGGFLAPVLMGVLRERTPASPGRCCCSPCSHCWPRQHRS